MEKPNIDLFNNEELSKWSCIEKLNAGEDYLISKFFLTESKESKIVEAGCGGGRILLDLQKRGFKNLYGFDLAGHLLKSAEEKIKQLNLNIALSKQNAVSLDYPDGFFDYAIYLQQIMSFIESSDDRKRAINECYRILKAGGRGIFSFLWWKGRAINFPLAILKVLSRLALKGDTKALKNFRNLPWLRLGGKTNLKWLIKEQPCAYWFRTDEVTALLTAPGFKILELISDRMIEEGKNGELKNGGGLYVVVEKV